MADDEHVHVYVAEVCTGHQHQNRKFALDYSEEKYCGYKEKKYKL